VNHILRVLLSVNIPATVYGFTFEREVKSIEMAISLVENVIIVVSYTII
jgi:hypothetical protein